MLALPVWEQPEWLIRLLRVAHCAALESSLTKRPRADMQYPARTEAWAMRYGQPARKGRDSAPLSEACCMLVTVRGCRASLSRDGAGDKWLAATTALEPLLED